MAKVAMSYGHGHNTYEDTGGKGVKVSGKVYEEHTVNAIVGEKVRKIIEAHGVKTLVVQPPNGKDVPLATRTAKANSWGADIYWSIHFNAGTSSARGLAGFFWKGSTGGLKLANLYAKYMKAEKFPLYSDGTYPSQRNHWTNFHELRETKMPALLTENGFMTNSKDFKMIFLNENNFHNRLAYAHSKAILEYFAIKYDPIKSGELKPVKPVPVKAPDNLKVVHRVIVEGKQVGAFGDLANALDVAEKALLGGAKKVELERV